jgi:hypothetical protein
MSTDLAERLTADVIEQRKVRFASIDGIDRADLPLAYEIWLDDIFKSAWATREAMKLAQQMVRYMVKPNPQTIGMNEIETLCQITPEDTRKTLALMRSFGAVDAFQTSRFEITAQLHLSLLQRLRVLETRRRLESLVSQSAQREAMVSTLEALAA